MKNLDYAISQAEKVSLSDSDVRELTKKMPFKEKNKTFSAV